jgi:hypothetical protein
VLKAKDKPVNSAAESAADRQGQTIDGGADKAVLAAQPVAHPAAAEVPEPDSVARAG